ncbi:MAG: methyltransferase [Candidatus Saccharibacteria bacterium]|nr:methyltransferase [Candidatus Saccharibacteria bacterium]
MKIQEFVVKLDKIVNGGQAIADLILGNGEQKKVFIWGGLPGETVRFCITKKRAGIYEGVVTEVLARAPERVAACDNSSYISTSPWQVFDYEFELKQKAELIKQAFAAQKIEIATPEVKTDHQQYGYRNKMEFAWWWDKDRERLDLAVYRRGSKGKIAVSGVSLAREEINQAAIRIRELLNNLKIEARKLKTLLVRCNHDGVVVAQLYVTSNDLQINELQFAELQLQGFELILSDPRSPASVITQRLQTFGKMRLSDRLLEKKFVYPAESFFQINLSVYQLALRSIESQLLPNKPIVDLYSGVGTIGLSITENSELTLVEINQAAVEEMKTNIKTLNMTHARAVLAASENAVDYITHDCQLIVDPPRAGLHQRVIKQILEQQPERIIYLSCNVVTQARDVALLTEKYSIKSVLGFNFFPRTPHIENLVVLDLK